MCVPIVLPPPPPHLRLSTFVYVRQEKSSTHVKKMGFTSPLRPLEALPFTATESKNYWNKSRLRIPTISICIATAEAIRDSSMVRASSLGCIGPTTPTTHVSTCRPASTAGGDDDDLKSTASFKPSPTRNPALNGKNTARNAASFLLLTDFARSCQKHPPGEPNVPNKWWSLFGEAVRRVYI